MADFFASLSSTSQSPTRQEQLAILDPTTENVDLPLPDDLPPVEEMISQIEALGDQTVADPSTTPTRPHVVIPPEDQRLRGSVSHPSPSSPEDEEMSILSGMNKNDQRIEELTVVIKTLITRVNDLSKLATQINDVDKKIDNLAETVADQRTAQINIQRAFTAYQTRTVESISAIDRQLKSKAQTETLPHSLKIDTEIVPPALMEHKSDVPVNTVPTSSATTPQVVKPVKKVNLSDWGL